MSKGYRIALVGLATLLTLLMELGIPFIAAALIAIIFNVNFSWILVIIFHILYKTLMEVNDTASFLEQFIKKNED